MGLALQVLLGASTSQMRRGEHNSPRKVAICHSPRRRAEGGSFCAGEVCYMFRVRGVQKKSQEG